MYRRDGRPLKMIVDDDSKTIAELRANLAEARKLKDDLALILGAAGAPGTGARRTAERLTEILLALHQPRESLPQSSRRTTVFPGNLTLTKIENLIKQAKNGKLKRRWHGDGNNLYLQISNNGAGVSWIFRYDGRRHGYPGDVLIGLGSYPLVDLQMARAEAHKYRVILEAGNDPKRERDNARLDVKIARGLVRTVSQVFDEYFEAKIARKSKQHKKNTIEKLKHHVLDKIGNRPIEKVDRSTLLDECGLRDLWIRKNVTGRFVRNNLDRMFKLAIYNGYYHRENPAQWSGGLEYVLAASRDVHKTKNYAFLPYKDAPEFMQSLRAYEYDDEWCGLEGSPIPLIALDFIVLTGARQSEVLLAEWTEFDLKQMIWTAPAEHIKNREALRRPITKDMFGILDEMQKHRFNPSPRALVFPSFRAFQTRGNEPIAPRTLRGSLLRFLKYHPVATPITIHGFRSTLMDFFLANKFPLEWWKFQVDHTVGNKADSAYGGDLLEERRGPMELWGDFLSKPVPKPTAGNVYNIADKREVRVNARR
jgi:integrase